MLKKIAVRQLRIGMHLHKLEGAWTDHPFWRARFVIDSTADLRQLHECPISECWIDTRLGLDVADAVEPDSAAAALPARWAAGQRHARLVHQLSVDPGAGFPGLLTFSTV